MVRLALITASLFVTASARSADPPVDFNRDVRPILSDTCYQCHGPDPAKRKADLRLDTPDGAAAVVKPGDSELVRRITAADESERMPPAKATRKLSPQQIDVLKRWVEQGAKWQQHWAFVKPERPPVPDGRNPIDHFIRARLEKEGLSPAKEADKVTLIRRVTLDLTGLPPTPEEVDAFLKDESPAAYEKVVDRPLASPRYGERMAIRWLEAARYADTNGYQSDGERVMWRWRDWVIDAYNHNLPFDRFTVEQVAGDLLPSPTLEQRIATGFNRNHRGNGEGGVIPEEYAVEYVIDRVETTATVWLGLTAGCARCHDHKFDPLSQREFYRLFAYFNNVPERGKAVKFGNSPPLIKAPTPAQERELGWLQAKRQSAELRFAGMAGRIFEAQAAWERDFRPGRPVDWAPLEGLVAQFTLDADEPALKWKDGAANFDGGKLGRSAAFDGRRFLDGGDIAGFGFDDPFTLAAWVLPEGDRGGTILSRMLDEPRGEGIAVVLTGGKVQVNLVKRWLDDALRVETERDFPTGGWHHVAVTYDASRLAKGIRVYIDGRPEPTKVLLEDLNQSFKAEEPFRIGAGGGPDARFRGRIDEVRVHTEALPPERVEHLATSATIDAIVATPTEKRSPAEARKLRAYFLERQSPEDIRDAYHRMILRRKDEDRFVASIPTTMVMEELPTPRDTFVLVRGQYDKPGEKVTAGMPAVLPPLPGGVPNNRLGLAKWLVSPDNPLTARVAVNRLWQMLFGAGLVKTVDDFGAQGEPPSHPELLDWLATEYVRLGWDTKAMLKTIVTSATYRQSSRVTKESLARDPDNRLLSRGPRLRLSAEMIRDQALFASGLLVEKLGGPSVRPYQPPGLWKELTGAGDYVPGKGDELYRRGLYTFWKRTVPPPTMAVFDAAGREVCTVRETRTNTPLQALTLLNDVTFVEAARALAARALREAGPTPEDRLARMFRLVLGRAPTDRELRVLAVGLREHLAEYRNDPAAARKLIAAGESKPDPKLDPAELAAYTAAGSLVLNLDEAVTKE